MQVLYFTFPTQHTNILELECLFHKAVAELCGDQQTDRQDLSSMGIPDNKDKHHQTWERRTMGKERSHGRMKVNGRPEEKFRG